MDPLRLVSIAAKSAPRRTSNHDPANNAHATPHLSTLRVCSRARGAGGPPQISASAGGAQLRSAACSSSGGCHCAERSSCSGAAGIGSSAIGSAIGSS